MMKFANDMSSYQKKRFLCCASDGQKADDLVTTFILFGFMYSQDIIVRVRPALQFTKDGKTDIRALQ